MKGGDTATLKGKFSDQYIIFEEAPERRPGQVVSGRGRALGVGEAESRQRHARGQEPCCFPRATRAPGPGLLAYEDPVSRELRGS